MATQILDTDSEDELPAGWEERVTVEGKVYYANHNSKATQWTHPETGKKKKVAGELPYGWERKLNETDNTFYFVDHINKKTTYTDPRLAFATEDKESPSDIKQKHDGSTTANSVLMGRDLSGKYAIITGANSGIGYQTARSLALHGAHVVMACRDIKAAKIASQALMKERSHVKLQVMACDLASLASITQFAENYKQTNWPLHMLILNAGVFSPPYITTEDGYELTFQTNHLGHYHLTRQLESILIASAPARVIIVSSESHRFTDLNSNTISEDQLSPPSGKYRGMLAYNQSKLCNVLFSCELNRRLSGQHVTCNALHPGNMISTGISRNWWFYRLLFALVRPFAKSMEQGAATTVYVAAARELEGVGGMYFNNCFQCDPAAEAANTDTAKKLWEISQQMIEKALNKPPHKNMERIL